MIIGSNGAIKQAVRIGVSLQLRHAISFELATGMLKEADLEDEVPRAEVVRLLSQRRRPAVEAFLLILSRYPPNGDYLIQLRKESRRGRRKMGFAW